MKDVYVDIRLRVKGNFSETCFHNLENALYVGRSVVDIIKDDACRDKRDPDVLDVDVVRVGMGDTFKFQLSEDFLVSDWLLKLEPLSIYTIITNINIVEYN